MAIPFVKDPNSPKIYDSRTGEWIPNEQEFFKRAKEAGLPSTKFQQGVNFRIGTAEQISKFTQAKPVSAPPYSVKTPLSARAPTQTSKKPFVPTAINTPAPVPTSRTQSTIIPSPKNYGNYDINTPFGITGGIRGSQNERSSDREGNLTQSAKEQLARIFPTEEKARQAFKSAQGSDNEFEFYWNQFKDLVSAPQTQTTQVPVSTPARAQTSQTPQTAQSSIPFVKDPNSPKIYDSRTGEWIPNEQEFFKRAKEAGLPSSKFQEGVNYRTGTGNEVSQIIAPYTGAQTRDMDILLNTPANQRTMNENALVAEYERGQSQTILTPKQLNESFAQLLNELITQDPFLSEQLKDPKTKAMFDALPDELKSTYLNVARTTAETIKKGKMVNPKIEITPEQAAKFLTQAHTELDPYYQEQIGFIQKDLDISFQRLQEDYEKNIQQSKEPFKEKIGAQAEAEAQAGLAFGSERGNRERRLFSEQGNLLDESFRQAQRAGEDAARQAERRIGSTEFGGLSIPSLTQYGIDTRGQFTPQSSRVLYNPQGQLIGEIPKQRTVDISQRKSVLP